MQRTRSASIGLLLMSIMLMGCSWFSNDFDTGLRLTSTPLHSPTPTQTPTCNRQPSVRLTTSAATIKVGETLTLTAEAVNVGMPLYALRLTSGANVIYSGGKPRITNDSIFEIVSMSSTGVQTFVLRGKQAGEADATVSASGELGCYNTGYSWGAAGSEPLHLEVTP